MMKDSKKRKALIISAGALKDISSIKNYIGSDVILICADGGLKYCIEAETIPDYIIGDFDSADNHLLNKEILNKSQIIRHSPDKDKSDTELALDLAISLKVTEAVFLACTGSRIDHMLANIHLLLKAHKKGIKASIVDENNTITLITSHCDFESEIGEIISLLPMSEMVTGIKTEGLKYPLDDGIMEIGRPYGISNEAVGRKVSISIKSGILILIRAKD